MPSGRQDERVTINKEFDSFDQFLEEYVTNISATGAFIKCKEALPVGTKVNLRFTVIMDGIETVSGVGRVVRHSSDPSGMGVVFEELEHYSKKLLERLLTAPATESCPPNPRPPAVADPGSAAES